MAGNRIMQLGRHSKRRWLYVLFIFSCIFLVVALILTSIGLIGINSQLVTIKTSDIPTSYVSSGYGISLDSIPVSNLIKDPSFELQSFSYVVKASDSSSSSIYFKNEDASWDTEQNNWLNTSLVGSDIRVLTSPGNQFTFLQSYEGKITGFSQAELGVLHEVAFTENDNNNINHIVDIKSIDNSVVALTEDGKIVSDLLSDMTSVIDVGDYVFTDIIETFTGIALVSEDGEIFFSTDGRSFTKVSGDFSISSYYVSQSETKSVSVNNLPKVIGLMYSNLVMTEVLDNGDFIVFNNSKMDVINCPFGLPVLLGESNEMSLVVNENCDIYISANGIIYTELTALSEAIIDAFPGDSREDKVNSIVSIKVENGIIYVLSSNGKIITCDINSLFDSSIEDLNSDEESDSSTVNIRRLDSLFGENITARNFDIVDSEEIILNDMQGRAYLMDITNDKSVYLKTDSTFIDGVFSLPDNKVVITSGDSVFESSVYMALSVDSVIGDDAILPGDLCYIEINSSKLDNPSSNSPWECIGKDSVLFYDNTPAVGYGETAAVLQGNGLGLNILSQEIGINPENYLSKDSFYRISLNLKQKGMVNRPVDVWLSVISTDPNTLKEETLYQEGFKIDSVGGKYKLFDHVFAVTTDFTEDKYKNASLRINIAYEGGGQLFVDGLYLGLDKYSDSVIINPVSNLINSNMPGIIRLNNLNLGCSGFSDIGTYSLTSNSVYIDSNAVNTSTTSIEDSLRFVRDCQAVPWLVIGSEADYDDISALVEYLCGSIGSEYGHIRIDNGTAIPWSRQFDKIYIEINDSESRFESDIQRSSYVNFIMTAVQQPEFYNDIKDLIVFVDGMNYEGTTVLSSADFHCGSLEIDAYDFYKMLNETNFDLISENEDEEVTDEVTEDDFESQAPDNFVLAVNELYKDYGYSVPRHNQSAPGDGGEMISSLKLTRFNSVRALNASELMTFFMCEQASAFKSIMLDLDFSSYSPTKLEAANNKSDILKYESIMVSVIGKLSCAAYSTEMICEFIDPLDSTSNITAEEFTNYAYSRAFYKEDKLYIIIFNTSNELLRFCLRSDEYIYEKNTYTRYSSEATNIYTRELGNRNKHYNLQPGEFIICEINTENA